ncbi:GTP-binding protein Rho1 [Linnemannia zychae]|nr:GTP-binding protein Rho1 [Linnemannia zychae]
MSETIKKLVAVGCSTSGKTCMLMSFCLGYFAREFVPTVFEHYVADVKMDGKQLSLSIFDTSDGEHYDRLRPLAYPQTHVFLLCFGIDSPYTFERVEDKWFPELRHFCSETPILLVACKKDLRDDQHTIEFLRRTNKAPISHEQGATAARNINAYDYLECSAKTGEGIEEVFESATRASLLATPKSRRRSKKCLVL